MTAAEVSPRTRSNPAVKRTEIMREALRIIGECGYNGFSIRQLANRCNLTNPGLLHYFGSKEKLLIALLQDRDRRDTEALSELFDHATDGISIKSPGVETVRRAFRAIVERNVSQPELVRLSVVLGAESLAAGHPARDYFIAKEKSILDIFSRVLSSVVPDPESKVRQILAALYGLEIQWLRSEQVFDLCAEWDRVLDQLLPPVCKSDEYRAVTDCR